MPPAAMNDIDLFSMYMQLTGVPALSPPPAEDPALRGKRLGLVNGSSWISLWSTYFGCRILPGVQLINVGNEAVQLNFMQAHAQGLPCPPQVNIDIFERSARELVELWDVDAILITCSTMNRAAAQVRAAMQAYGVPVIQIDEAMMEAALQTGGRILVIATHGPTVRSTQELLSETAMRLGREVSFAGATVEEAFHLLGRGDIRGHNEVIAKTLQDALQAEPISVVVLAQLSMSVFKMSYPDCRTAFGVEVLTSGETGFQRAGAILRSMPDRRR